MTGSRRVIPIFDGLVEAKHVRCLGMSLWLYLYLVRHADWTTGVVNYNHVQAAKVLGWSRDNVRSHLRKLVEAGYVVRLGQLQYGLQLQITKWRDLSKGFKAHLQGVNSADTLAQGDSRVNTLEEGQGVNSITPQGVKPTTTLKPRVLNGLTQGVKPVHPYTDYSDISNTDLYSDGPPSLSLEERQILNILKGVKGYPFDYQKDLEYLRMLAVDFPSVDLLREAKRWATYKLDKPLSKRSNPRLQFRRWCENSVRFAKNMEVVNGPHRRDARPDARDPSEGAQRGWGKFIIRPSPDT